MIWDSKLQKVLTSVKTKQVTCKHTIKVQRLRRSVNLIIGKTGNYVRNSTGLRGHLKCQELLLLSKCLICGLQIQNKFILVSNLSVKLIKEKIDADR